MPTVYAAPPAHAVAATAHYTLLLMMPCRRYGYAMPPRSAFVIRWWGLFRHHLHAVMHTFAAFIDAHAITTPGCLVRGGGGLFGAPPSFIHSHADTVAWDFVIAVACEGRG